MSRCHLAEYVPILLWVRGLHRIWGRPQKEYQSLLESSSGLEQEYHQILSWADLYDHCSIAKKKMIVSQLIKAVYVRQDYEITVEFNISFDDFHTLEYHEKAAP